MESVLTRKWRALPARWKKSRLTCSSLSASVIKVPLTAVSSINVPLKVNAIKITQSRRNLCILKILSLEERISIQRTWKEEATAPFSLTITCQSGRSIHTKQSSSSQYFAKRKIFCHLSQRAARTNPSTVNKVWNLQPLPKVALNLEVMVLLQMGATMERQKIVIWWLQNQVQPRNYLRKTLR